MQQAAHTSQTPELDHLRPRVLRALRDRGWTAIEPSQVGDRFTVRAKRVFARSESGSYRTTLAVLEFVETACGVTFTTSGHGAHDVMRDLRAEGVLS